MSDIAVKVEGLGKKYIIGQQKSGDFRQSFGGKIKSLFDKNGSSLKQEFWALKNINLEVKKGEAVGVIGRNGAGKSTLLKVLSRITEPTKGKFEINGRVSSLLEVGTGFHMELTGRENIYLNGTILGMKRREIKAKLDEIVDFSGVEKFIDTPVKHYSSGMQVRLAFSVAAYLDPEILIVDEVLAVGDADFQRKCLGRMREVSLNQGRTVLFVSHQMNAIQKLCSSCILVDEGNISLQSVNINHVISSYYSNGSESNETEWKDLKGFTNNEYLLISRFGLYKTNGINVANSVSNNEDLIIKLEGEILKLDPRIEIGYRVKNEENEIVYTSFHYDDKEEEWPKIELGLFKIKSILPKRLLNEGAYTVELIAGIRQRAWFIGPGKAQVFFSFEVRGGLSDSPIWHTKREGIIAPVIKWFN